MSDQVEFLKSLHDELVGTFGEELGTALLGTAAAEFFAGPQGVTRMFERQRPSSKPIPPSKTPR